MTDFGVLLLAIAISILGFCIDNGLTNIGNAILKYLEKNKNS